jgi:hypothetical protein
MNGFDTIKYTFSISPQEYLNITPEQVEEGKREAARRARMEIVNKMDKESRENLSKK